MASLDPFETFRWGILGLSVVYFLWQMWVVVDWIGSLPGLARKYAILVLLRCRWSVAGREVLAIAALCAIWIALLSLNLADLS